MKLVAKRKVKVRVTIKKNDGSLTCKGWEYEETHQPLKNVKSDLDTDEQPSFETSTPKNFNRKEFKMVPPETFENQGDSKNDLECIDAVINKYPGYDFKVIDPESDIDQTYDSQPLDNSYSLKYYDSSVEDYEIDQIREINIDENGDKEIRYTTEVIKDRGNFSFTDQSNFTLKPSDRSFESFEQSIELSEEENSNNFIEFDIDPLIFESQSTREQQNKGAIPKIKTQPVSKLRNFENMSKSLPEEINSSIASHRNSSTGDYKIRTDHEDAEIRANTLPRTNVKKSKNKVELMIPFRSKIPKVTNQSKNKLVTKTTPKKIQKLPNVDSSFETSDDDIVKNISRSFQTYQNGTLINVSHHTKIRMPNKNLNPQKVLKQLKLQRNMKIKIKHPECQSELPSTSQNILTENFSDSDEHKSEEVKVKPFWSSEERVKEIPKKIYTYEPKTSEHSTKNTKTNFLDSQYASATQGSNFRPKYPKSILSSTRKYPPYSHSNQPSDTLITKNQISTFPKTVKQFNTNNSGKPDKENYLIRPKLSSFNRRQPLSMHRSDATAQETKNAGKASFTACQKHSRVNHKNNLYTFSHKDKSDSRSDKDISKSKEIWTPGDPRDDTGPAKIHTNDLPSFKEVPPVWTPRSASASPGTSRRSYRKLDCDVECSKKSSSHRTNQEGKPSPQAEESYAWKNRELDKIQTSSSCSSINTLPKIQSPTVTLLQKKREGHIPVKRPDYDQRDNVCKPGDKLYTIKREYESDDETGTHHKYAVLGAEKVEGVGPIANGGIPVTLKSGIKSEHQGEWYKRMFDSLHKVKDGRYGAGGYASEPEYYDSDGGTTRYVSLNRKSHKFDYDVVESHPKLFSGYLRTPNLYEWNTKKYAHQPGRIENYVPGFSTLSQKELINNPEADVKVEIHTKDPISATHRFENQRRMQMRHALKDGYESDSTLVFRKKDDYRKKYYDQKYSADLYRQIQQGGEIPFSGLQKPAPHPPIDSPYKYKDSEVNIHYRLPVRNEQKEVISDEELVRRQDEHMKRIYEQERRKKYLSELEDIERRRHTDNFTPQQKSPIPLNRYDEEAFSSPIGVRTPEPRQVAKVLYNFAAQNKREITLNKGDVVTIRRQIDRNWYEGEVRGVVGIFPANYVEIVPFDSLKSLGRKPREGQGRARFNFQAQTTMELSLNKGDMVLLTRRVDENWYEGRVGNRRGIFPVTYVEVLHEPGLERHFSPQRDPIPRPALPASHLLYNGTTSTALSSPFSTMGRPTSRTETLKSYSQLTVNTQNAEPLQYKALYHYKPQNEDELELRENDVVHVMEKCDDGWFVGTSKRTGLFGTFPGNYVERC